MIVYAVTRGDCIKRKLIIFILITTIITTVSIFRTEKDTPVFNQEKEEFSPKGLAAGSETHYEIHLEMDSLANFKVHSKISVKNLSADKWNYLLFYFVPNMFTEENSPNLENPSAVKIESVTINGNPSTFQLKKDTLNIILKEELPANGHVVVDIQYEFTLPEKGLRFTKNETNYFLAQWYPMLATYRDNNWNKEEYRFKGETYHTHFSNFKIHYSISDDLTIVSSSDMDSYPSEHEGVLEAKQIKEFFIALLKEPNVLQQTSDDVTIRVFGIDDRKELNQEISEVALKAFNYFQQTIGPYPHKQLDIILDELAMEYPGVVTANSTGPVKSDTLKRLVVHEIAHQWFYGIISNDPYHDAWLDEGITELASFLFSIREEGDLLLKDPTLIEHFKNLTLPVNLPLHEYASDEQSSYIYGKSSRMMLQLFQENGGKKQAEEFLGAYYDTYQYKEVDTEEFVRFIIHHLDLKNDDYFKDWLSLDE